jgi:hypothetical protein
MLYWLINRIEALNALRPQSTNIQLIKVASHVLSGVI